MQPEPRSHLLATNNFNDDGDVETTLTTNEFEIGFNANSGGGGHNNASYNSKSDSSTNTTDGYWTYVGNSDSTYDETSETNSSGSFSIEFSLSKETGEDDASGSVDLTFDGTAGDSWHIFDESNSDWTNT